MIKIKISYDKKDYEKSIYKAIQLLNTLFNKVKIQHEYTDKKGRSRIHIDAE